MVQKCPKCESWKPKRTYYKRKLIKGKPYWIIVCVGCKTPLDLEPYEKDK